MINSVTVKGITIGEGIPKICVPIVAKTAAEAEDQARAIAPRAVGDNRVVDLVEWRADWLEDVDDPKICLDAAVRIRSALPDTPLLFTFRTRKEGGNQLLSREAYIALTCRMASSGLVNLVDVELSAGDAGVKQVLETAHQNGVYVICSNHDFKATPSRRELLSRLDRMEALNVDILKIVAMPRTVRDVLKMMDVTEDMSARSKHPLVIISMSRQGVLTRVSGETFGSALTFGTLGVSSAPGQIDAEKLSDILKTLHG